MKTLTRTGAVLSLGFFSVPGIVLMFHAHEHGETGAAAFGSLFIGLGCFAGTLLWYLASQLDRNPQQPKPSQK